MIASPEKLKNIKQFECDRAWFIGFSVALLFGLIWAAVGASDLRIVFVTVAFTLFLHAGVRMEMSARALDSDAH